VSWAWWSGVAQHPGKLGLGGAPSLDGPPAAALPSLGAAPVKAAEIHGIRLRLEAATMRALKHTISIANGLVVLIALFCGYGVTKAQSQAVPNNQQTNGAQAEKEKTQAEKEKAQAEKRAEKEKERAGQEKARAEEQKEQPGNDGSGNDNPPVIPPPPPQKPQ
jgi:hypothetical protein